MIFAETVVAAYIQRNLTIATAESCTGGLLAATITDVAGSSAVLERGFVTYSNKAKTGMLGVPPQLLAGHGAVSAEVAAAMAAGALLNSTADVAMAITGIAGPSGGSVEKPVGLVHFACCSRHRLPAQTVRRFGDIGRAAIRNAAVDQALHMLFEAAS